MMKLTELNFAEYSALCKFTGALFYYQPSQYQEINLLDSFASSDVEIEGLNDLIQAFANSDLIELQEEHDTLLAGIGDMEAPPWGSVYLDREEVIFGESTLVFRTFLRECNLDFNTPQNEPEDQVGLMLMVLGILLEQGRIDRATTLLDKHLNTWFDQFIKRFNQHAQNPSYQALGHFSQDLVTTINQAVQAE